MCVIYVAKTQWPDEEELKRGAERNTDGAGIAWLALPSNIKEKDAKPEDWVVQWKKGLKDHKDVIKFIEKEKIRLPAMIHFRTASVGGKLAELCHPFPVMQDVPLWTSGYASQVLFHNGHISDWESLTLGAGLRGDEYFPVGDWSDSRALAWLVYLKGEGILPFVLKGSRAALFHSVSKGLKNYSREEDHIEVFGHWYDKGGYSQSIETDFGTTFRRGRGSYSGFEGTEMEDVGVACSRGGGSKTPGTGTTYPANVWTVEEIAQLMTDLEAEQRDAQIAAGV